MMVTIPWRANSLNSPFELSSFNTALARENQRPYFTMRAGDPAFVNGYSSGTPRPIRLKAAGASGDARD
jgi:hypothetical protein